MERSTLLAIAAGTAGGDIAHHRKLHDGQAFQESLPVDCQSSYGDRGRYTWGINLGFISHCFVIDLGYPSRYRE
jgi:hypothetical protein